MAELTFPDNSLTVAAPTGGLALLSTVGLKVRIYSNSIATTLATIKQSGVTVSNSELTVGSTSTLPDFTGPDGTDVLYGRAHVGGVATGPIATLYARRPTYTRIVTQENLTQAVLDSRAATGESLHLKAGIHTVATVLTLRSGVPIIGAASNFGTATGGTVIQGTNGNDMFRINCLTVDGEHSAFQLERLKLVGGRNQILVEGVAYQATHMDINLVEFSGPQNNAILINGGAIEEWYLKHVLFGGGQCGLKKVSQGDSAGFANNYIDKCTFEACTFAAQSVSGFWADTVVSNKVTFIDPVWNLSGEHALYWRGGNRGIMLINSSDEQCGTSGKKNRTTLAGTVSSGSNSATLVNAVGWATGDQITIMGAGASGEDLVVSNVSVSGNTVFWATPTTSTTVTDPKVTNAKWDAYHFEPIAGVAGPGGVTFVGGLIGGESSGGRLRYSTYVQGNGLSLLGVYDFSGALCPAYNNDTDCVAVGGAAVVRLLGKEYATDTQTLLGPALGFTPTQQAATANAGAATLPANPVGFFIVKDSGGTSRKIPYYAT